MKNTNQRLLLELSEQLQQVDTSLDFVHNAMSKLPAGSIIASYDEKEHLMNYKVNDDFSFDNEYYTKKDIQNLLESEKSLKNAHKKIKKHLCKIEEIKNPIKSSLKAINPFKTQQKIKTLKK
jgi:hypothetical protein